MAVDPQPSKSAEPIDAPPLPASKPLTLGGYVAIGVAVVVIAVVMMAVQRSRNYGPANGPVTFAIGDGSTSTLNGHAVAPPSEAFVRYSDPSHRQRKFGEAGEGSARAATQADSIESAHAAQVAKEQHDAIIAAAKADAATAAAGAAAAKATAATSSQPASSGQPPITNFNPVGRWVRQDGANDYQFFRSDGVWYESDGTESTAAADTFPEAARWQLETQGDTTYITTGVDRFTVIGADTIRGEKSGTFIRVGE